MEESPINKEDKNLGNLEYRLRLRSFFLREHLVPNNFFGVVYKNQTFERFLQPQRSRRKITEGVGLSIRYDKVQSQAICDKSIDDGFHFKVTGSVSYTFDPRSTKVPRLQIDNLKREFEKLMLTRYDLNSFKLSKSAQRRKRKSKQSLRNRKKKKKRNR